MHPELEKTRRLIDESLIKYIPQGGARESPILEAMRYMLANPDERIEMGRRARRYALGRSFENAFDTYWQFYGDTPRPQAPAPAEQTPTPAEPAKEPVAVG